MLNATPLLKSYAKLRLRTLTRQDCAAEQSRQLLLLIRKGAQTAFGRRHGLDRVRSVADYQNQVPLRSYEDFWNEYWQAAYPRLLDCTWPGVIPFFPLSSGTSSGTTKYIPCSWDTMRSNVKAALDVLVFHCANRPQTQIFAGKSFVLGGSTDLRRELPGIYSGDLSGIVADTVPWWARQRYFPTRELALLKNWEEKIEILAARSLEQDIRSLNGVPSWLLLLFNKLFELRPEADGRAAGVYPQLELIIHGGVNFAPYYSQFTELLRGSRAELREVYPASEGFIAAADRGYGEGLRLMLDHGMFFEFVPLAELHAARPTRHWIGNVEPGVNYAIVMTTCSGLWSYVLGDTVRFVDLRPPRVLVTGRTSYYLSAFGEHLLPEEIEDSVAAGAAAIGAAVVDYSVMPVYPRHPGELGGHVYYVEFAQSCPDPDGIARFAAVLDERLQQRNEDYAGHRAGGFGLRPPAIKAVPPGSFAEWMKGRGKLGGQHKVPRVITKPELSEHLQRFMDPRAALQ